MKSKRRLSLPEVGAAASHRNCYEKILNSNLPFALIFEDDCEILDVVKFNEILKCVLKMNLNKTFCVSFFTKFASVKISSEYDKFVYSVVTEPSAAVCYFITQSGAKALLTVNRDLTYVADWPKNSGVKFYLAKQKLIETDLVPSLIASNRGSTSSSYFYRYIVVIAIFSGVHYCMYRKHFKNLSEYLAIMIFPTIERFKLRMHSSSLPNLGTDVKLKRLI